MTEVKKFEIFIPARIVRIIQSMAFLDKVHLLTGRLTRETLHRNATKANTNYF